MIFESNYFQAIQTAIFYKKKTSNMFKRKFAMFLTSRALVTKTKN